MISQAINAPQTDVFSRALSGINLFLTLSAAAIRCSAAVESGRRPKRADLRTLGINELSYPVHPYGR